MAARRLFMAAADLPLADLVFDAGLRGAGRFFAVFFREEADFEGAVFLAGFRVGGMRRSDCSQQVRMCYRRWRRQSPEGGAECKPI